MDFPMFQRILFCFIFLVHYFFIISCLGGELSSSSESESESETLFSFLRSVDPKNVLNITTFIGSSSNPCMLDKMNIGIRCDSNATNVVEIRLENLNLSGTIDADSLCMLKNLRVVSLAKNRIRGEIPHSILHCTSLVYLNLSENQLSGKIPHKALRKLKHLQYLDITNNNFSAMIPIGKPLHRRLVTYYETPIEVKNSIKNWRKDGGTNHDEASTSDNPSSTNSGDPKKSELPHVSVVLLAILGTGVIIISFYFAAKNFKLIQSEIKGLSSPKQVSTAKHLTSEAVVKKRPEETGDSGSLSELVFFVEEHERFTLEDLLRADADLRSGSFSSSLFKVRIMEKGVDYAVKRLKNLQVSDDEFEKTLRQISNLKHPNILPLVGYRCTSEEKLVIYKYQSNGSLLNLLNDHIAGRKNFSWKLRLSIACGIARGLAFIYKKIDAIPHGNLKLSNILLNEKNEPLISEHGLSKFQEPSKSGLLLSSSLGYTAPERSLTEKGDVYSFGVILLELLTGKSIETSRIDLARWVRAMVREEWTGEVFDKEVKENEHQWAFPVLNIALMCVSRFQENRPNMVEILEKIEEVMDEIEQQEMLLVSKCCSNNDGSNNDCCSLHKIIPDTWDSPGSNY